MKIQSIFTAAGILAIAMTSCTSDETVMKPGTQVGEISYRMQTNNITRSANSYSQTSQPLRFKVWAFDNGANYFSKSEDYTGDLIYTDDGTTWTSDEKRFWPSGKPSTWEGLDFYAYVDDVDLDYAAEDAGTPATGKFNSENKTFEGYTVLADVSQQRDLLYAYSKNCKPNYGVDGSVALQFRHALSQICFKAKNVNPWFKNLKVTGISLNNVPNKGTFTFPAESTTEVENKGSWVIDEDAVQQTHSLTFSDGIEIPYPVKNEETDVYDGAVANLSVPTAAVEATGDSPAVPADHSKAVNVIPQSSDEGISVTIKYTTDLFEDEGEQEVTVPLYVEWEPGYRYIYTFKFSDTVEVEMTFSADVNDWNEVEEDIEEDINKGIFNGKEAVLMRKASWHYGTQALYFATCNIGAESPQETGYFFNGNYPYRSNDIAISYPPFPSDNNIEQTEHVLDWDESLKLEYDTANILWGGNWTIPNRRDIYWLRECCTWTETVVNGVKGYLVKSVVPDGVNEYDVYSDLATGNEIFLPYYDVEPVIQLTYFKDEQLELKKGEWGGILGIDSKCYLYRHDSQEDPNDETYSIQRKVSDNNWAGASLVPIRPICRVNEERYVEH